MALLLYLPTPTLKPIHTHRIQNAEFVFAAQVYNEIFLHASTGHTPQRLDELPFHSYFKLFTHFLHYSDITLLKSAPLQDQLYGAIELTPPIETHLVYS